MEMKVKKQNIGLQAESWERVADQGLVLERELEFNLIGEGSISKT